MGSELAAERPTRKQQQRSIRTRQKLLDAALQAFSENGFKGTSTREIADRAGVHHPLITYHFKNKETLWRASADHVFAEFNARLERTRRDQSDQPPRERMASMIRTYVRYAARNPALYKLLLQESSGSNSRLDWLIEAHLKPVHATMIEELEPLQRQGTVPSGNTALLLHVIRAAAGGTLALADEIKGTSGIDLEQRDTIEALADMLVAVFLPSANGCA